MSTTKPTHEPLPTEIDRDTILQIKARFLHLNQERKNIAQTHLTSRQQQCIEVLPLLLHFNHPRLPGYHAKTTPSGISHFSPSVGQLRIAKSMGKGFRAPTALARKTPLLALYVMGSVGTVAQSSKSDMDFWLCHSADIFPEALLELEKKCELIAAWAKDMGLEWHFFLMQPEAFSRGEHGHLSTEGSGSAQHFLLLDEFYRSAILVAGRLPIWWFITSTDRTSYDREKLLITEKGFLRDNEWLDFGPVGDVPPSEFVSAAVWQLYKSITSPYKSLLKLLMLEVYLSQHPHVLTLSDKMKLHIYTGNFSAKNLDPYLFLLRELSEYFIARKEFDRLELMRQCFYFKLEDSSSKIKRNGKNDALIDALESWQWEPLDFQHLNMSTTWNAQQVMSERNRLVNELTASYRLLLELARQTQASLDINSEEISVLGRKLHAAFDHSIGKIEFINPAISKNISANYLLFFYSNDNQEWHIFLTNNRWERTRTSLMSGKFITELVCWCYFNQILASQTRIKIEGHKNFNEAELQTLVSVLDGLNMLPMASPPHAAFTRAVQPKQALLLINDPALCTTQKASSDSADSDPLNSVDGALIQQYTLLIFSTWGEVRLVQMGQHLSNFLQWLVDQKGALFPIQVSCLARYRANAIERRLQPLIQRVQTLISQPAEPPARLIMQVEHTFIVCERALRWQIVQLPGADALWHHLAQPLAECQSILLDAQHHPLDPLLPISEYSAHACIQVFYRVAERSVSLYYRDERGSLLRFQQAFHEQASLLKPLHHFIRAVLQRNPVESSASMFGIFPVEFYELLKKQGRLVAERRHATSDIGNLGLFQLQFCVESLDLNQAPETWVLSAWLDGESIKPVPQESLFVAVARAILAHRQSGQRYPCFITDVDLSLCQHQLHPIGQLQTSHFMQVKIKLEQALNKALQNL